MYALGVFFSLSPQLIRSHNLINDNTTLSLEKLTKSHICIPFSANGKIKVIHRKIVGKIMVIPLWESSYGEHFQFWVQALIRLCWYQDSNSLSIWTNIIQVNSKYAAQYHRWLLLNHSGSNLSSVTSMIPMKFCMTHIWLNIWGKISRKTPDISIKNPSSVGKAPPSQSTFPEKDLMLLLLRLKSVWFTRIKTMRVPPTY